MNYNTLLVKYKNSWQLRTYEFSIKTDEKKNESDFEKIENEIDSAFSEFDDVYHFEGRSAYVSVNRSKNKIFYYARSNDWTNGYFCTLTIDPKRYNSFDYRSCSDLIRKFTNYLRNYDSSIYALIVPERHKSGAFHFHGLISEGLKDFLVYSGHDVNGQKIYNCTIWKYGFSNITKVQNTLAVEKYVTKYTTKELLNNTKYQHRYFTLNLSESPEIRYNLYNHKELFKELLVNDCVLFCNTDGMYNRVTYCEIKACDKSLQIIEKYVNITNGIINKQTD